MFLLPGADAVKFDPFVDDIDGDMRDVHHVAALVPAVGAVVRPALIALDLRAYIAGGVANRDVVADLFPGLGCTRLFVGIEIALHFLFLGGFIPFGMACPIMMMRLGFDGRFLGVLPAAFADLAIPLFTGGRAIRCELQ